MVGTRFELTKVGETCEDISKEKVKSRDECEEAVKELSANMVNMRNWGGDEIGFSLHGCIYHNGAVIWRRPASGRKKGNNTQVQEICRNGGKYNTLFHINPY